MARLTGLVLMLGAGAVAMSAEESPDPPLPAWAEELRQAHADQAVRAAFVEERHNRLRPRPTRFTGTLRVAPGHGVSLAYDGVFDSVIAVSAEGIVRRSGDGEARDLTGSPEMEQLQQTLLAILRFDFPWLREHHQLTASGDHAAWTLRIAADEEDSPFDEVEVTGAGERVAAIEIHLGPGRRVEIRLGEHETVDAFSAVELARYFP